MNEDLQKRIQAALANPQNMGELANADSVGTVGNGASQFGAVYTGAGKSNSGIVPAFDPTNPQTWIAPLFSQLIPSKDHLQRLGLILLGAALVIIGVLQFTKTGSNVKIKVKQAVKSNAPNSEDAQG